MTRMMEEKENRPPPTRGRRKAVAAESYDPTASNDVDTVVFHPKTVDQLTCLQEAAKGILFINNCDKKQQQILYNAMFEKCVKSGDLIIKQGDDGDNFYIIEKGEYDILINDGEKDKCVATLKNKGYFGELALLYNCPRSATIIAKNNGVLWGLDQKTFRHIVVTATARKRQAFEKILQSVSILDSLTDYELMNLTDALSEVQFPNDELIIKEGDGAEKMYFIMDGEVSVRVRDKKTNLDKEIVKLKRGQYFGELALVLNKPRVASVVSISDDTTCAVLDIYAFERLLGPCVDIMKRNIENYENERKRLGINSIASGINDGLSNNLENMHVK